MRPLHSQLQHHLQQQQQQQQPQQQQPQQQQTPQQAALMQSMKTVVCSVLCLLLVANIVVHFCLVQPTKGSSQTAGSSSVSSFSPAEAAVDRAEKSGNHGNQQRQQQQQQKTETKSSANASAPRASSSTQLPLVVDRRRASNLSLEEFRTKYRLRRPLLLTFEHGASDWLVNAAGWTLERLTRQFGSYEALAGRPIDIVRAGGRGHERVNFGQFLRAIRNSSAGETRYIFSRDFFESTHMDTTLKFPAVMSYNVRDHDLFLFLGGNGSGVAFHKHADAWNAVVSGKKRWFLYPSERAPPGGVHHAFEPRDWLARVYSRLNATAGSHPNGGWPIECEQGPGEILYIPEGFYHATINLEPTVAIGIQNVKPIGSLETTFYNMRGKSPAEVEAITSNMLRNLPKNTEVLHKLAMSRKQQEKYQEAERLLEKVLRMDENFLVATLDLAEIKWKYFTKTLEADALFKRALDLNPNLWEVHAKYGEFLTYQVGDLTRAVAALEQAAELRSDQLMIWQMLRTLHDFAGNETGAAAADAKIDQLSIIDDHLIDF